MFVTKPREQYAPPESTEASASQNLGTHRVGNGVSMPVALNNISAKYSEEARRAGITGACLVTMTVDVNGTPKDPRVVKGLGYGLDEKALEAVKKYRFKPAVKDGVPFAVAITVEVNFRLY